MHFDNTDTNNKLSPQMSVETFLNNLSKIFFHIILFPVCASVRFPDFILYDCMISMFIFVSKFQYHRPTDGVEALSFLFLFL